MNGKTKKLKNLKTHEPMNLRTYEQGFSVLKFLSSYVLTFFSLIVLFLGITAGVSFAAPIIDCVDITSITDNSVIITFRTTNETTTAEVFCGLQDFPATANWSTSEASNYHYAIITGLNSNFDYRYQIKCYGTTGMSSTGIDYFTTLSQPTGTYLFSFAILSDMQYAEGASDTSGARGRPYSRCAQTLVSATTEINAHNPSFTMILGDNIDAQYTSGDQVTSKIKPKLDGLTKAPDSPGGYAYFPMPGNHDKLFTYSPGDWVTKNIGLLYPPMNAVSPTTSCDANYDFVYHNYHFIALDSVNWDTTKSGSVDVTWLESKLTGNYSTFETFIFLHYPALNVSQEGAVITLPYDPGIPAQIDNYNEFQSIVNTHKNHVAGVYMGHIHDSLRVMKDTVPYVRVPSLVQFPLGYTIVKVYTNGFMNTFYKVKANNISEIARNCITGTASLDASICQQLWLGANSARNFTQTYSYINGSLPSVQYTNPTSGATSVTVNQPIKIRFTKAMTTDVTSNWVTIPGITLNFTLDPTHTLLTATPTTNLSPNTAYTVTASTDCKDERGNAMASAYTFTFTTTSESFSPTLSCTTERLNYDVSTDDTPVITGIATADPTGVASVEYKIDTDGTWTSATSLDGMFNSTTEAFVVAPAIGLNTGRHELYIRVYDTAGNVFLDPYVFYVVTNKPWFETTINGNDPEPGDPITETPSIESFIVAANGLNTGSLLLNFDNSTVITSGFTIIPIDPPVKYMVYYTVTSALSDGSHDIKLLATDLSGNPNTWEGCALYVQSSGTAKLQGAPLNFPNPFAPGTTTQIGYSLTKAATIQLSIYDLMGTQLFKRTYSAGTEGGDVGYNKVSWDGKTDSGVTCGYGIYIYVLVADGQLIGRGKLTILE
ncbi:MAG: Ig-like domain-containing protein [Candidatus Saganbacteria bacterium]|nr:Ig-like domain-containing protein [Candidatus Saganbacteria bacterium]